jgi:hypothetical protein
MSNYVPWYGKKRVTLARRERDLIRLLARGGDGDAVDRAAEAVREAKVRWLNAERARIRPCDGPHAARGKAIEEQVRRCLSMSVNAIVAECRAKPRE